jgi:hypothetical protein
MIVIRRPGIAPATYRGDAQNPRPRHDGMDRRPKIDVVMRDEL